MHAWAIRKERHGPPEQAMQLEVLPTWPIGEDEVLVYVMAGGVNYNGVWAGLGLPISPSRRAQAPVPHRRLRRLRRGVGVGSKVKRWKVGDEVIVHCNQDDGDDEDCNGGDPLAVAVTAHLGLRDAGRLVRAVLPRAVAPAHAEAARI